MQLEELQKQWKQLDQKLDQSLALGNELMRQVVLQPTRRRVHRLAVWPVIDVLFCVVVLVFSMAFLSGHGRDLSQAAPAGVLILGAFALLASSIRQLHLVAELDWGGPVADIQTSLEQLRAMRIRQFKWIILFAPLVGFCGLMVGLHWLFEWLTVDRVKILDQLNAWIITNYAFGVLFVPLGYFLARVLAKRCHQHRWWQAVLDDISGKSLNTAALDIKRWACLQQEMQ